jgi:beta-glucosidase
MKKSSRITICLLVLLACLFTNLRQSGAQQDGMLPYKNPSLPVEQRVDDLVSRMTLEEKVSQMMNGAAAIERLGIPEY